MPASEMLFEWRLAGEPIGAQDYLLAGRNIGKSEFALLILAALNV